MTGCEPDSDSTEYKLPGKHYIKKVFINLSRIVCFYLFIKNRSFLSFGTGHMQINVVVSGYPRSLHCMTHSQLFYKGLKRSY